MKKILTFIFGLFCSIAFSQQNSENGYSLSPNNNWKVLLIWAEVTNGGASGFTQASSVSGYGKAPLSSEVPDFADFFDLTYTAGVQPTAYLSKYFYQMSFGKHIVIGDHLDHVIQVDASDPKLMQGSLPGYTVIYDYLNSLYNINPSQFSTNYLVGQSPLSDFDKQTILPNYVYTPKPNSPNGKFDGVIILWHNHPSYGGGGYAFLPQAGNGNYGLLGFSGVENDAAFGSFTGEGSKKFIIQEYFHALFGDNSYHTGAGAGTHTFFTVTNPYGIPAQLAGAGVTNAANGWDRHRLGWYGWKDLNRTQYKTNLIAAVDQSGNEVNTDFTISSSLGNGLFVLRDHVQYGDAIRIKLPHLQSDPAYPTCKNQYLWVENHQKINGFNDFDFGQWEQQPNCKDPTKPGMWGFIQVGKDVKSGSNVSSAQANAYASYIFPLDARGNFDYKFDNPQPPTWADCSWYHYTIATDRTDPATVQNPFTGFNDMFSYYNSNGDNVLSSAGGDNYYTGITEGVSGNYIANQHSHGDGGDAFNSATGKMKISLSDNPTASPILTLANSNFSYAPSTTQRLQPFENRSIWLNGISVEIIQENYLPAQFGTGAILVKVRFDEYEINKSVRWCGLIKLSPNDFITSNYSLKLTSGNNMLIDRGKSYTNGYAIDQDPITNEYRFSELTEFTILPSAYFLMDQNTNTTIDGNSTMRIKSGGKLEINSGSNLIVKKGSTLILEAGAQLLIHDNSFIKVEQGGTLMYDNSSVNLAGNNAYIEFEGTLNIASNANFTFTGQGYVKFTQPGWINPSTNPSNIVAGTNSQMTLIGANINDQVLVVTQESMYLSPLVKFTLKNGIAQLGSNARMCMDKDVLIQNAHITSIPGSLNNHRGFNTYGQSNINVSYSTFDNGNYGFYAINTYGGAPITFTNCQFKYCQVAGLTTVDKGATLNNCTFSHCLDGWVAQGMTFPCSGTNTNASNNTNNGITFTSASTSSLFLDKPTVQYNSFTGIAHDGASMLTTHCASINHNGNPTSSYGYGIDITNNAILNQSPNVAPYGGDCDVSSNVTAVEAACANNWYSDGGRNNYSSTFRLAGGTFNTSCANPVFSALDNKWHSSNLLPPVVNSDYVLKTCNCGHANYYTYINLQDPSPMNNLSCSSPPPNYTPAQNNALVHSNPIEFCPTCEKITTPDFSNVRLNEAVKSALSYIEISDSTKSDVKAINLFSQILQYHYRRGLPPTTKLNDDEFWLIELSLSKIKEALGNSIKNNKATASLNSVPVKQTLASIDSLINIFNFKESDHKALYFYLDKASIYALVNERKKAIDILDNMSGCFSLDPEQITYINKLRATIYTEQLVLNGQISKEDFPETYIKVLNGTSQFNVNGLYTNYKVDSSLIANTVFAGDSIKFYSSDQSLTNNWSFGDCTTNNSANPIHIYSNQGVYNVKLIETLQCTSKNSTSSVTVLPKPTVKLSQNISTRTCDKVMVNIKKMINFNVIKESCYNNGSKKIDPNNYRFKFSWDLSTPFRKDFDEIYSYNQIALSQDSVIHIPVNKGEKHVIKLKTDFQTNIAGTWKSTGYIITTIDSLINDSLFQSNISINNVLCQMDSVHIKTNISGGIRPYNIQWFLGGVEIYPANLFNPSLFPKMSGDYHLNIVLTDSIGCSAVINFPQSGMDDVDTGSPEKDSTKKVDLQEYIISIPQCKSINGYALVQSNCNEIAIQGVAFGLIDDHKMVVPNLRSVTDNNGYFEFDPVITNSLDSTRKYMLYIVQPSKYTILKPTFDYISSYENGSPLSVFLNAPTVEGIVQNALPETAVATLSARDMLNNKYIAGTVAETSLNYFVQKQDSSGNVIWTVKYDGYAAGTDSAKALYIDTTSNVYVTGQSWNGTKYEYATVKYDSTGSTQWVARYADSTRATNIATNVGQDSTGNILVSGKNIGQTTAYTTVIYSDCKVINRISARTAHNSSKDNRTSLNPNYSSIYVYPNPTDGSVLNIANPSITKEPLNFELYDNTGRSLYVKTINSSQEQILTKNILNEGIYFYYIKGVNSGIIYKKDKLIVIKN